MPEVENSQNTEKAQVQKVGQEQIHSLLFSDRLSWQSIIYDLINTEQLDPWDINLSLLTNKYLEKIKLLEEANYFVSSKVLLAAALLLRMKSEILLDYDLTELDEILFGKKEEKKYAQERIDLDDEIPELVLRTPLPRYKKVSLDELMSALGKAINTETRRIKKITLKKQQEFETSLSLPKHRINIQDKIKEIYAKLEKIFSNRENKLAFSELVGGNGEERVPTFVPLLYLDNQHKIWIEQEGHCEEIWILLKTIYEKQNVAMLEEMRKEAEIAMKEFNAEEKERAKKAKQDNANTSSEETEDEKQENPV
jgi:segregation and condensation protein A